MKCKQLLSLVLSAVVLTNTFGEPVFSYAADVATVVSPSDETLTQENVTEKSDPEEENTEKDVSSLENPSTITDQTTASELTETSEMKEPKETLKISENVQKLVDSGDLPKKMSEMKEDEKTKLLQNLTKEDGYYLKSMYQYGLVNKMVEFSKKKEVTSEDRKAFHSYIDTFNQIKSEKKDFVQEDLKRLDDEVLKSLTKDLDKEAKEKIHNYQTYTEYLQTTTKLDITNVLKEFGKLWDSTPQNAESVTKEVKSFVDATFGFDESKEESNDAETNQEESKKEESKKEESKKEDVKKDEVTDKEETEKKSSKKSSEKKAASKQKKEDNSEPEGAKPLTNKEVREVDPDVKILSEPMELNKDNYMKTFTESFIVKDYVPEIYSLEDATLSDNGGISTFSVNTDYGTRTVNQLDRVDDFNPTMNGSRAILNTGMKYVVEDNGHRDYNGLLRTAYCTQYSKDGPNANYRYTYAGNDARQAIIYVLGHGVRYAYHEMLEADLRTGLGWKYDYYVTQMALHIVRGEYSFAYFKQVMNSSSYGNANHKNIILNRIENLAARGFAGWRDNGMFDIGGGNVVFTSNNRQQWLTCSSDQFTRRSDGVYISEYVYPYTYDCLGADIRNFYRDISVTTDTPGVNVHINYVANPGGSPISQGFHLYMSEATYENLSRTGKTINVNCKITIPNAFVAKQYNPPASNLQTVTIFDAMDDWGTQTVDLNTQFRVPRNYYHDGIAHWAGGFKKGEGNNSNKTMFKLTDTGFEHKVGTNFVMDASRKTRIPNGFYLADYFGTGSISSNGSWTTHSMGTTVNQQAKDMWFEYDYHPYDYKITYELNGGTNNASNPSTYNVLYGVTFAEPTRPGFDFLGWYNTYNGVRLTGINEGANASFSSATDMYNKLDARTTGNITLEARWQPKGYIVKYNGNGSTSGSMADQQFGLEESKALSANEFTKTGYIFKNWNTKADGSGTSYSDQQVVRSLTSSAGQTINLYAQWTPITYTVKYHGNGSTAGTTADSIHTYDVAKNLNSNKFTKPGYVFESWNTKEDGEGTDYENSQSVKNLTSTDGAVIDLYAQWKPIQYTVHFVGNGETSGKMDPQQFAYDERKNLSKNQFVKENFFFDGWIQGAKLCSGQYFNFWMRSFVEQDGGHKIKKIEFSDIEMPSNAINQKDLSEKGDKSIMGWTDPTGSTVTVSTQKPGKRIMATSGSVMFNNMNTLEEIDFSNLDTSFVSDFSSMFSSSNALKTIDITGFNLSNAKNCSRMFSDMKSLTTIYVSDSFKLSDNVSSANMFEKLPALVGESGTKFDAERHDSTMANYQDGYFTYKDAKESGEGVADYTDEQSVSNLTQVNGDVIYLFANWKPIKYTVHFDGNGASSGSMKDQQFTCGQAQDLTANAFEKTGYMFQGWNTKADGEGTSYKDKQSVNNLTTVHNSTVTLYAQWTPNKYTIVYDGNGETGGSTADSVHTYDVAKALTANGYTKTGYVFKNWNTKADGKGTSYEDEQSVKNLTTTNNDTITLYAQWIPIQYTIEYNGNGATGGTTPSVTHTYDEPGVIQENGFVRDNFKFVEWNTKPDGSGTSYTPGQDVINLTTKPGDKIVLYAIWTEEIVVVYDGNGATSGTQKQEIVEADDVEEAGAYTIKKNAGYTSYKRTDHMYLGWYKKTKYQGVPKSEYYLESKTNRLTWKQMKDIMAEQQAARIAEQPKMAFSAVGFANIPGAVADTGQQMTMYSAWDKKPEITVEDPNDSVRTFYEGTTVTLEDLLKGVSVRDEEDGKAGLEADLLKNLKVVKIEYAAGKLVGGAPQESYVKTFPNGMPEDATLDTWFMEMEKDAEVHHKITYQVTDSAGNVTTQVGEAIVKYNNFPTITAEDRWFTVEEAQAGMITEEELLDNQIAQGLTFARDKEEGDFRVPGTEPKQICMLDFDAEEFTHFEEDGYRVITLRTQDTYGPNGKGKETIRQITIHVVKDGEIPDENEGKEVRFISKKYYDLNKDVDTTGMTEEEIEALNNNGGLRVDSVWYKDPEYRALIEATFEKTKGDTYSYTLEEVEQIKAFVDEHGIGNSKEPDALEKFEEQFGACTFE